MVDRIREFVPSVRVVEKFPQEVRQSEWDAVVASGPISYTANHLFGVVQAPRTLESEWTVEAIDSRWSIRADNHNVSEELLRYPGLPESVERLAHEILEPIAKRRGKHTTFSEGLVKQPRITSGGGIEAFAPLAPGSYSPQLQPFLATGDRHVLAGSYTRPGGAQVWVLPGDIPDIVPWVKAALTEWHKIAPDRFPSLPDWADEQQWQTPAERKGLANRSLFEAEKRHIEAHLEQRAKTLRALLDAAKTAGDTYERALLTADSEDLVDAVITALRELGFAVVDADRLAKADDKVEDLHISDPGVPGWLVIAEVKGFTKGASTVGIQQLARFSKRYLQRTGNLPSGEWYIANQFRNHDPATRQPILNGRDEDVDGFAQDNGLVIDTRTLFRTLDLVRSSAVTARAARDHFRAARGIAGPPNAP
ncbi:hypothetical protein ACFVWG_17055 [Kribbella sp. NPDC058245]|uniref:hypothetical protein n=1 Tax=Kribbella sp. NPDC058245 TaxID=3346399 RepID=UPI0036E369DA